jgi:hypothetical protein
MADDNEPKEIDETVPGGRYIVGDRVVNAHGEEIGKAEKADLKIDATPDTSDQSAQSNQQNQEDVPTVQRPRGTTKRGR